MLHTFWMTTRWAVIPLAFGTIIFNIFFPEFFWSNELFHVFVEAGGSLIGFALAMVLLVMIQKDQIPVNYTWLIICFISMGTLDLFHSQIHPGQTFVWLHSVATFIGGLFAMLIWLPATVTKRFFKPIYFWLALLASIVLSIYSILLPESLPPMLDESKQFTLAADALNVIGGIGFLGTWFYFAREYHRRQNKQSYFFSNHFCLFGIAGLLFEFSILWDGNWWFWHMMRAFAYFLLIFHFSSIYRKNLQSKIEQSYQIFDQTLNEIYMFDKDTLCFVEANQAARNNLGYTMSELKNMSPVDIKPEYTEESFLKKIQPLIDGSKDKVIFQTIHRRKDGTDYNVDVHLSMTNIEPFNFFAVVIDTTETKVAENERTRLQNELQQSQKMESLGQLTGGIAHDFNNLLGIINGYTDLAIDESLEKENKKIHDYVCNIKTAALRATSLIKQMLVFSRQSDVEITSIDLAEFVKENINMLRSTLPSTLEITTDIENNLPEIMVNQTQLHQILLNLAINARDAMKGSGKLSIQVKQRMNLDTTASISHKSITGTWVELSVSDTGSGIQPDILNKIFNPFFTTKDVGKGTGMGLSMIYRIMENNHGHILVDSEIGHGTTFRMLFPPCVSNIYEDNDPEVESSVIAMGDGSEILIVDDEALLANHLCDFLTKYDYKPYFITDSTEAFDLFKNDPDRFSLLITDQTMPIMTGVELVEKLRAIRAGLPVIMCSGFSENIDKESAFQLDISFMDKPIDSFKLLSKVHELLDLN